MVFLYKVDYLIYVMNHEVCDYLLREGRQLVNGGELFDAVVSTNQLTIFALPYDLHDK